MINTLQLDYKNLRRTRKLNGLTTIEFTVFPTKKHHDFFDMVVEEAVVEFKDAEYVIKNIEEKSIGTTYYKQVTAIHKFYVDLMNKQQPTVHNGSITFRNYMNMVFGDTPYASFDIIDQFNARSFENLGNDNRLALLQKGLDRFKAELELIGSNYKPRLRKMVGNNTDFQFRYGHNVRTITRDISTNNLATVIRGTGDPELGIVEYYRSDKADIFGEIDATPVDDERFKSKSALLEEMKDRLIDEPEVTITVDFVDLRAAGYPYTVPNEGDRVWLIYEPMDGLLVETRILEIVEVFDKNEKVIRTEVTLSNHRKSFANTVFDNVRKQLDGIINDDGIIRYNALDQAVKIATESLQSAQTELEFNNGIIAREKTNPNRLVLLNSAGIGISKDGGHTFTEAITADGFVLTAGAIGKLSANHIQIGPETDFKEGYDPTKIKIDLDEFEDYVNEAFKDGVIQEAEAKAIEKYLNSLAAEKDALAARVETILGNDHVNSIFHLVYEGVFVNDYLKSYNSLVQSINNAIADGKTTPAEKADVDNKFTDYREKTSVVVELIERAADSITENRVDEADTELRENLRLAAPLPTSLTLDESGITAYTADPNKYARLDYRGLYIKGGAIQIDGGLSDNQIGSSDQWNSQGTYIDNNGIYTGSITANQVQVGFNNISNYIKMTAWGIETYDGLDMTSRIDETGHRFYRDGQTIGHIGTSSWINDSNYRGLRFGLQNNADYMSWGFMQTANATTYTTMFAWHKTGNKTDKGFTFSDDVTIQSSYALKLSSIRTNSSTTRRVDLYDFTWNGRTGFAFVRNDDGSKLWLGTARAALISSGNAYIEVGQDSTGNFVQSVDIRNRAYQSSPNVHVTSLGTLGFTSSARKYKRNIENLSKKYAYRFFNNVNPSFYKAKNTADADLNYSYYGYIADDVAEIEPRLVQFDEDGEPATFNYDRVPALLHVVLKNERSRIDTHEQRLNEYDNRFDTIENRIKNLENELADLKGAS